MAYTASTAFAGAFRHTVQSNVLKNLRDELVWGNPRFADQGRFDDASDQMMWLQYPDLSITTPLTPITEGTTPTARTLTQSVVTVQADQYGDLVGLTDLAKLLAPTDLLRVATERVTRVGKQVIDRITRDNIFLGGTPYYALGASSNVVRSDIASTEILVGADLIKLFHKAQLNNIPFYEGNSYLLMCSQQQAYDIKRDTTASTSWLDVEKYSNPESIINGEMGKVHGIRVIAVNTAPTFSSTTTVHAGILLGGEKGWGSGSLQTFQMYHTAPGGQGDELHQKETVGWKVMWGVATLNNSYYFRVESAATSLA